MIVQQEGKDSRVKCKRKKASGICISDEGCGNQREKEMKNIDNKPSWNTTMTIFEKSFGDKEFQARFIVLLMYVKDADYELVTTYCTVDVV